jgi:hypothetical protein
VTLTGAITMNNVWISHAGKLSRETGARGTRSHDAKMTPVFGMHVSLPERIVIRGRWALYPAERNLATGEDDNLLASVAR